MIPQMEIEILASKILQNFSDDLKNLKMSELNEIAKKIRKLAKRETAGQRKKPAKKEQAIAIDTVSYILRKARNSELISRDDEQRLIEKIQDGDKEALDKLILANVRWVINIAKRYLYTGVPLEDLIGYGNLGLIIAAKKFKSKDCKFSTYATFWIRQQVLKGVIDNEKTIRLPTHIDTELKRMKECSRKFFAKLNRVPSLSESAQVMKMREKKISQLGPISAWQIFSLDAPAKENQKGDNSKQMEEILNFPSFLSPEEGFAQAEAAKKLKAEMGIAVSNLSEKERFIVSKRFLGDEKTSLEKIGVRLDLSKERVHQIEKKILQKLRNRLRSRKEELLLLIA